MGPGKFALKIRRADRPGKICFAEQRGFRRRWKDEDETLCLNPRRTWGIDPMVNR